jgi:hypothetical protein
MWIIAWWMLSACGWWDQNDGTQVTENQAITTAWDTGSPRMKIAAVSLWSVPTSAPFEVEGKLGYGWIYFEHPISGYANGPYINPYQSSSYNPRDVLSRLGITEWIIVRASFSYELDRDNNGVVDASWTSINSGMSMLIHRSVLERGEKIVFSPKAALLSDLVRSRTSTSITKEALDSIARSTITEDGNADGIIDYSDMVSGKTLPINTITSSMPWWRDYMESVYSGDGARRTKAIKTLAKMENHLIRDIVANPNNHDPMLRIQSIAWGTILYTLDGSTPLPNWTTTLTSSGVLTLPLQPKRVYYREQFAFAWETILGKVKSFDLATDWTELSQDTQAYNNNGKQVLEETTHSYNEKSYTIRVISNKTAPGFTYPKFIDCQVGANPNDGCHLGPYIMYNEAHETKVRAMVHSAAQAHIGTTVIIPPTNPPWTGTNPDTPKPPTHYKNELTTFTSGRVLYKWWWYEVQNQWNPLGTNDYPVTIIGNYSLPNGTRQPNIVATANNETERLNFSQSMVSRLKSIIEAAALDLPKPTYPPNYQIPSSPVIYRSQTYTLITIMNTSGMSDYPASVKVKYSTPSGVKETLVIMAKSSTELAQIQAERIAEAKSQIDMALGTDAYPPNFVQTITPERSYAGWKFRTTFTYSWTPWKDYPGYIDVYYKRANNTTWQWTMQVSSEAQKNLFIPQGEDQAKLEIDNYPLQSVNQKLSYGNKSYGTKWWTYTRYEIYNRKSTGYNFPVLIWFEYRPTGTSTLLDTRNTYGLTEAKNSEQLSQIAATLESWVKWQMVALGPIQTTQVASVTGSRVLDFMIPSAYAQTPSSIISKNGATKLTSLSPYSPDISYLKGYHFGDPAKDFFIKPGQGTTMNTQRKSSIVKSQVEDIQSQWVIAKIDSSVWVIRGIVWAQCTQLWVTINSCIFTPEQDAAIEVERGKIFWAIGEYLNFGAWVSVWASEAVYEELIGTWGDVTDLVDGKTYEDFKTNLSKYKSQIAKYVVNGTINFSLLRSDLVNGTSAIEQEISSLLADLPWAINSLDAYNKWYYAGVIGWGAVLELTNPLRKPKIIAKWFTVGKWLYKARYLTDSNKAWHTLAQKIEIMKKLDKVRWSRVDKPDITKITNTTLFNIVRDQYKTSSTIGNGSSADALRYEKTTGILLSDKWHQIKTNETISWLKKLLNSNDLSTWERTITNSILNDLLDANQ